MFGKSKRSGSGKNNGVHEVEQPSRDVQTESTEDSMRDSVERRERLSPGEVFDNLEETYREQLPKTWDELNNNQKLEWFAHRMLLDERESIRQEHGNDAARDIGFLSDYQLERRRRREVQSKLESWDDVPPRQGIFSRTYVDKNNLITPGNPEENNGQKNP
jgi:hypothetical protein